MRKRVLPYQKRRKTSVASINSESDLQIAVVKLLRSHGYIPVCTDLVGPALRFIPTTQGKINFTNWSKARGWCRGFPDLLVVRPTGFFWLELKFDKGKLSPDQIRWRDFLIANGYEWKCWRTLEECRDFIVEEMNKRNNGLQ